MKILSVILSCVALASAVTVHPRVVDHKVCPIECTASFNRCKLSPAACSEEICPKPKPPCRLCPFCRTSSTIPPPSTVMETTTTAEPRHELPSESKFCPTECAHSFAQCKLSPAGCSEEVCKGNTKVSCRSCEFCLPTEPHEAPTPRDGINEEAQVGQPQSHCAMSCVHVPRDACRYHKEVR